MFVTGKQKAIAVLSYLLILVFIPLLTYRDDRFIHYHAKQGLMLMLCWIVFIVIAYPLTYIPYAGIGIIAVLGALFLCLNLVLIIGALLGRMWLIPVLGMYADEWQI